MIRPGLRVLLAGSVDYAGLFPPAQLPMEDALRSYLRHRGDENAWMLGAFVLPGARIAEFLNALGDRARATDVRVSVLLGNDPETEMDAVQRALGGTAIRLFSAEARTPSQNAVRRAAEACAGVVPLFCEIPPDDPVSLLGAIQTAGARAKVRTGGVTMDLFPPARALARFILGCVRMGVAFKATAGLHHPFRGEYPLTYEPDAPRGVMYGFLNVLVAAALARAGAPPDVVESVLEERDPAAFVFGPEDISWRGHSVSAEAAGEARRTSMTGFGSCSFLEPVRDLTALGLL